MSTKRGLGAALGARTDTRVTTKDATVGGKIPVTQKNKINMEEWSPIGNALKLPIKLMKLAAQEKIEFHWLSSKQIAENQGVHVRGWKVFRIAEFNQDHNSIGLYDYDLGKQADGTIRRGSMVLGYKPVEAAVYHRDVLAKKSSQSLTYEKDKARQLAQASRQANVNAKIYEGYDENS